MFFFLLIKVFANLKLGSQIFKQKILWNNVILEYISFYLYTDWGPNHEKMKCYYARKEVIFNEKFIHKTKTTEKGKVCRDLHVNFVCFQTQIRFFLMIHKIHSSWLSALLKSLFFKTILRKWGRFILHFHIFYIMWYCVMYIIYFTFMLHFHIFYIRSILKNPIKILFSRKHSMYGNCPSNWLTFPELNLLSLYSTT